MNSGWNDFWGNLIAEIKSFFNPTLTGYNNLNFGSDKLVNIHVVVFGIFIGVMIASVYSIYTKQILGKFVRALLKDEILSPESAKTPAELGFGKNLPVLFALGGYTLGRVVNSVERDRFIAETNAARKAHEEARGEAMKQGKRIPNFKEPKFDKKASECHYYITEKNKSTAEMRFNPNGSGYITFFFVLLVSIMCIVIIYALLPGILAFADAAISDFTVDGNTMRPNGG